VDSDTAHYSSAKLSEWKREAEVRALAELEGRLRITTLDNSSIQSMNGASLRLVDIIINDELDAGPLTLEVKVRNAGAEVAFIKRAQFEIFKVGNLQNSTLGTFNFVKLGATYNVKFSPLLEGRTIDINVSQAVEPGGVDRFEFKIGQEEGDPGIPLLYHFRLRLLYNEMDLLLESQPITIALFSAKGVLGFSGMGIVDREISNNNFSAALEFSALPGLCSNKAKKLVSTIIEKQSPNPRPQADS